MPRVHRTKGPRPGVSCAVCKDPDNSRMVCCDDCGLWYHFKCVDVDEGIEEKDWSCSACKAERAAQNPSIIITEPVPGGENQTSHINQKENELLKEFQKRMNQMQIRFDEQQQAYEMLLLEKDREMQNAVNDLQYQFQLRMEKREQQIREELNILTVAPPPNANSTALEGENIAAGDVCKAFERMEKQLEEMARKQNLETKRIEDRLRVMENSVREPVPTRND